MKKEYKKYANEKLSNLSTDELIKELTIREDISISFVLDDALDYPIVIGVYSDESIDNLKDEDGLYDIINKQVKEQTGGNLKDGQIEYQVSDGLPTRRGSSEEAFTWEKAKEDAINKQKEIAGKSEMA
jgi:hypothetical protein